MRLRIVRCEDKTAGGRQIVLETNPESCPVDGMDVAIGIEGDECAVDVPPPEVMRSAMPVPSTKEPVRVRRLLRSSWLAAGMTGMKASTAMPQPEVFL
jgi:hypothetical protein